MALSLVNDVTDTNSCFSKPVGPCRQTRRHVPGSRTPKNSTSRRDPCWEGDCTWGVRGERKTPPQLENPRGGGAAGSGCPHLHPRPLGESRFRGGTGGHSAPTAPRCAHRRPGGTRLSPARPGFSPAPRATVRRARLPGQRCAAPAAVSGGAAVPA